jgi:hypothetical protein
MDGTVQHLFKLDGMGPSLLFVKRGRRFSSSWKLPMSRFGELARLAPMLGVKNGRLDLPAEA